MRPSLARTGGMWIAISSPYRRGGLLYTKHQDHFDIDDDDVLVVRGATELFNPTISAATIAKEIAKDPEAGRAEWSAEFSSDISAACSTIRSSRTPSTTLARSSCRRATSGIAPSPMLPPDGMTPSASASDIVEGKKPDVTWECDVIRGRAAPFDARSVAQEYAHLARQYGCTKIVGDAFAGEWVAQAFRDCSIAYETSKLNKAALYLEALPHFNRGIVSHPESRQADPRAALVGEARAAFRQGRRRSSSPWFRRLCQRPGRRALRRGARCVQAEAVQGLWRARQDHGTSLKSRSPRACDLCASTKPATS